jgi:hypothetical protein
MQQSPGYIMGQRPSDTFFVTYSGNKNLDDAHQEMMRGFNVMDSLRRKGGAAADFADMADKFGPMATAYLGQHDPVRQAMGGNIDLFSRRILGGATSISGGGTLASPGLDGFENTWERQQKFHRQHLTHAMNLGKELRQRSYVGGDIFNPNTNFTKGFQIEEIADVVNQLGYEGQVKWDKTTDQNANVVGRRLGKLAAARNVFGDADVNVLQQKTEGLLGTSLGANDEASAKILAQISAEARVLNKDVDNMVKSREVIKNTLISINKARDSRGVNLTYDGSGSISGDLEVKAQAIGSIVDHATAGLPQKVQEGMSRNMTRTLLKDVDSDAGRLATLMQNAMMSGEVSQKDYGQFMRALRSGNTRGASDIARRRIENVDQIMSDQVLYENTISWMQDYSIKNVFKGDKDKYQEEMRKQTTRTVDAIGEGGYHQGQDRMLQGQGRTIRQRMQRLTRLTGVEEDERTDAEKMREFRDNLRQAATAHKDAEIVRADNMLKAGKINKDQHKAMVQAATQGAKEDIAAIGLIKADSVEDLADKVRSGYAGVSEERADSLVMKAGHKFLTNRHKRLVDKVKGTGKLETAVALKFLEGRGGLTGSQAEDIMAIEDEDERKRAIAAAEEKFFKGDKTALAAYRRHVQEEIDHRTKVDTSTKMGSGGKGGVTDATTDATRKLIVGGQQKRDARGPVVGEAMSDDANAAENLAKDKNNMQKLISGISELITAIAEGKKDNLANYADGDTLKVKIVKNEDKAEISLLSDGGGNWLHKQAAEP